MLCSYPLPHTALLQELCKDRRKLELQQIYSEECIFLLKHFRHSKEKHYLCALNKKTITLFITKIVTEYKSKKRNKEMKKGIHPENYRPVVFKDMSNGDMFLSRSTVNTKETIEFEGETYPLVKLEISSTSHPFYTGKSKLVDTAGRVDKFMSRYARTKK